MKPILLFLIVCILSIDAKPFFWKKICRRPRVYYRPAFTPVYGVDYGYPMFPIFGIGNGIGFGYDFGLGSGYGYGQNQYAYGGQFGSQQVSSGGGGYATQGVQSAGASEFHNVGEHHNHATSVNQVEDSETHAEGGGSAAAVAAGAGGIGDYYQAGAAAAGNQLNVAGQSLM